MLLHLSVNNLPVNERYRLEILHLYQPEFLPFIMPLTLGLARHVNSWSGGMNLNFRWTMNVAMKVSLRRIGYKGI